LKNDAVTWWRKRSLSLGALLFFRHKKNPHASGRRVGRTDAGYRFLVFSQKSGDAHYEPGLVDKLDDKGAENYFLHTVAIHKFFDEASRKKFQAHMPEGVLLIDSAEKEYEANVHIWSGGRYRHEPVDY